MYSHIHITHNIEPIFLFSKKYGTTKTINFFAFNEIFHRKIKHLWIKTVPSPLSNDKCLKYVGRKKCLIIQEHHIIQCIKYKITRVY